MNLPAVARSANVRHARVVRTVLAFACSSLVLSACGGGSGGSGGSGAIKVDVTACAQTFPGGGQAIKCGPRALSDGTLKLVVDSDLDGSGAGRPTATAGGVQGKSCELSVRGGMVTVAAGSFVATAQLDGEPQDQVMGDAKNGVLVVNDAAKKLQVMLQYVDPRGVESAQVNISRRSVTCLAKD